MVDTLKIQDDKLYELEQLGGRSRITFTHPELNGYRVYSEKMESIFSKLKNMSLSGSIPLMIKGPTGSGKEMVARFLHHEVDQSPGQYIAVNCTNMNKEIFESELFGYQKGAFTGANVAGHDGYIKQARQGTLFLDEVSEIDLDIQAKLLRVLEEGEFYKLGSSRKEQVEARMIFASNKNLAQMVKKGQLREDLYFRLNVVGVEIPGLKDRREEILPLVTTFIHAYNEQFQKQVRYIQGKVLKFFYFYNWPGNIRELKNFVTQIMIFIEGDTIRFNHLEVKDEIDRMQAKSQGDSMPAGSRSRSEIINELIEKPFDLEDFTLEIIRQTLKKFGGNKAQTARHLGLKREQLYNRYKIDQ
jgi:transcriptional regulator with PAS, ATPase and Fis domain